MLKLLLFCFITVMLSCASSKYGQEHILEKKTDSNGVVILKKVKQKFRTNEGEDYSVITYKRFDSLGRIIQKYGFESWGRGEIIIPVIGTNNKYLIEYRYVGHHLYLTTSYVWPTKTDSNFTVYPQFLVDQRYTPDSLNRINGSVEITIYKWTDSVLTGQYGKRILVAPHRVGYSEWFDFEIKKKEMEFYDDGRLKMEKAIKKYDFFKNRKD